MQVLLEGQFIWYQTEFNVNDNLKLLIVDVTIDTDRLQIGPFAEKIVCNLDLCPFSDHFDINREPI